jgi:nitrogen fixation protein
MTELSELPDDALLGLTLEAELADDGEPAAV